MSNDPKIKMKSVSPKGFFATKGVFSPQNVVMMGILTAVAAILSRFSIYLTPTFKAITFTYLPGALVAMLFGPWAGLAYGFVSDTAMYLMNPQGGYFPGFAISEMVSCFIYACFLYRQRITVLRVAAARALILLFVMFGLNFVWLSIMYGQLAGGFFTGARRINNLAQFPFHVAITWFAGKRAVELKRHFSM